jgi:hypothetical protein
VRVLRSRLERLRQVLGEAFHRQSCSLCRQYGRA